MTQGIIREIYKEKWRRWLAHPTPFKKLPELEKVRLNQRKAPRAMSGGIEGVSSRISLFLMRGGVISRKQTKSWYT